MWRVPVSRYTSRSGEAQRAHSVPRLASEEVARRSLATHDLPLHRQLYPHTPHTHYLHTLPTGAPGQLGAAASQRLLTVPPRRRELEWNLELEGVR